MSDLQILQELKLELGEITIAIRGLGDVETVERKTLVEKKNELKEKVRLMER